MKAAPQYQLPNGDCLTEQDLAFLQDVLLGIPRKLMARKYSVSVKAIEKRLAFLKAKLFDNLPYDPMMTLQQALVKLDLLPFLLPELKTLYR